MADFNQTPSGQTNVTLSLPSLAFSVNGTGTWNQPNYAWSGGSTVALTLGSASITLPGRLLGSVATVSTSTASGIFTLNEQSAAKRLGAWP